jgi:hypothetical protein
MKPKTSEGRPFAASAPQCSEPSPIMQSGVQAKPSPMPRVALATSRRRFLSGATAVGAAALGGAGTGAALPAEALAHDPAADGPGDECSPLESATFLHYYRRLAPQDKKTLARVLQALARAAPGRDRRTGP